MSIQEINLNRTARPRFNTYEPDGLGRDTYISHTNGGFWTNVKPPKFTPNYPVYHNYNYHSLQHFAAPFKYYSDGSGRDSYVIDRDGGLRQDSKPLSKYHLKDFLRTPESCIFNFKSNPLKEGVRIKTQYVSKKEMENNVHLKSIEKGLIKRLYTSEKKKNRIKFNKIGYIPRLRDYRDGFPSLQTEGNYHERLNSEQDLVRTNQKYQN